MIFSMRGIAGTIQLKIQKMNCSKLFPYIFCFFREWHQNFREECPEGILDKQHIIKIYDEISVFGSSKEFVDNIMRIFDKDGDGTIDFIEFMIATDMTHSGTPEEKLRWAFKVCNFTCLQLVHTKLRILS